MALPEPSTKEGQNNKPTEQEDKDFDPTPEALIDEIDDERTLEEEEALGGNNGPSVQEELDDLKKESEMPIEELLAYYERMRNEAQGDLDSEDEEEEEVEDEDEEMELEEEEEKKRNNDDKDDGSGNGSKKTTENQQDNQHSVDSTTPHLNKTDKTKQSQSSEPKTSQNHSTRQRYPPNCNIMNTSATRPVNTSTEQNSSSSITRQPCNTLEQNQNPTPNNCTDMGSTSNRPRASMTNFIIDDDAGGMFKTLLGYDFDDSDEMDEDYSYTDDENGNDERDWRRVIHVGPEYQADIPEDLIKYDDLPPYENEDKLVWKCISNLTSEQILDYLKQASLLSKKNDISISPLSVPKISSDCARLYRERMQDITSSTGSHTIEHNNKIIVNEFLHESQPDVYMSQSRKRARIDYELEQENAMDGINQSCGAAQNQPTSSREENSDSTSQDLKPELSTEEYFQDEEQLLFLLLQCNHNLDEALRRRKLDPTKYYLHEPMSLWSQEECLGFEHGLRNHGKDFRSIRENKVPTRTHAELVAFYYLWKKSERHDVYTNQYELDRKRCLSHPGTTDYMDKFIEDNESILNASSTSTPTPTESSVGITSTADTTNDNLCHSSDQNNRQSQPITTAASASMNLHFVESSTTDS